MMAITPAQENERMLARLTGISEEQAAAKLNRTVVITHGDGAAFFAQELRAQLERTVHVTARGDCDLEVAIHAAPAASTGNRLYVALDAESISISQSPGTAGATAVPLHGLQTMIAACFAAGVALRRMIDGLPGVDVDPFVIRFDALGATRPVLDVNRHAKRTPVRG
jgi:hypothetical protein